MLKKIFFVFVFLVLLTAFSGCVKQAEKTTKPVSKPSVQPQPKPVEQPQEKTPEAPAVEQKPVPPPSETLPEQPQAESFDFNKGLLVYHDFDSETPRQFLDASGNNNHASKINFFVQTTVDGLANSRAASLSGRNDYMEIDNMNFRGDLASFTISVWVNVKDLSEIRNIFSKLTGHSYYPDLSILREGEIVFNPIINSDSTKTLSTAKNTIQGGKWHHIVLAFENSTKNSAAIYIDGKMTASKTFGEGKANTGVNTLWLGRSAAVSYTNFAGAMDEFRLYNRVLPEEEIKELHSKHAQLAAYKETNPLAAFFTLSQSITDFLTSFFR